MTEPLKIATVGGCFHLEFSIDKDGDLQIESDEPGSLNGPPTFFIGSDGVQQLRQWLNANSGEQRYAIQAEVVRPYHHNEFGPAAIVVCPRCASQVDTVAPNGSKCSCGIEWTQDGTGFLPDSLCPEDFKMIATVRLVNF